MKGEQIALVRSMERWKHILKSSFEYIVNIKSDDSIFQHWFADLAQFEFIVIHKKGMENVNADAFSRSNHLDEPTKKGE